jgi:hypothetical protein
VDPYLALFIIFVLYFLNKILLQINRNKKNKARSSKPPIPSAGVLRDDPKALFPCLALQLFAKQPLIPHHSKGTKGQARSPSLALKGKGKGGSGLAGVPVSLLLRKRASEVSIFPCFPVGVEWEGMECRLPP